MKDAVNNAAACDGLAEMATSLQNRDPGNDPEDLEALQQLTLGDIYEASMIAWCR